MLKTVGLIKTRFPSIWTRHSHRSDSPKKTISEVTLVKPCACYLCWWHSHTRSCSPAIQTYTGCVWQLDKAVCVHLCVVGCQTWHRPGCHQSAHAKMAKRAPHLVLLYIWNKELPTKKSLLIAHSRAMEGTQLHSGLLSLWAQAQTFQNACAQLQRTIKAASLDPVRDGPARDP